MLHDTSFASDEASTRVKPTPAMPRRRTRSKAAGATSSLEPTSLVPPQPPLVAEEGQPSIGTQSASALLGVIRELHQNRQALMRAEVRLELQIQAIRRRLGAMTRVEPNHSVPSPTLILEEAQASIREKRKVYEKSLVKAAKQLPQAKIVDEIRGLGMLGFAQIVAEVGDFAAYDSPSKVWKRMGLAPYMGKAAGTWKREGGLSAKEWTAYGYSPIRRSIMHVIGDSAIKVQGPLRDLYLQRKEYERAKAPDLSDMQTHLRALRYIEKRLLLWIWQAWRLQ